MASILEQLLISNIVWKKTEESEYVFRAVFQGKDIKLRLNDFPDEPLCTVTIGDQEVDLDDFGSRWSLP